MATLRIEGYPNFHVIPKSLPKSTQIFMKLSTYTPGVPTDQTKFSTPGGLPQMTTL